MNQSQETDMTPDKVIGPAPRQLAGEMDRQGMRPIQNGRGAIRCIDIDPETIVRFYFKDLEEQEATDVKAHLETCERCCQELAALTIADEISKVPPEDYP